MKVSVCLTYYNRKQLLINTLESIKKSAVLSDTEIIIVDDASDVEHRIESVIDLYSNDMNILFHRFEPDEKTWSLQIPAHNKSIAMATGDVVIQQGAECYNVCDIITHAYHEIQPNDYLVYGCYALTESDTNRLTLATQSSTKFETEINNECNWDTIYTKGGWYQHSIHRPGNLNFCTAICRDDLNQLGGFDERFSYGKGGGDMEFLLRIYRKKMNIKTIDDLFVYHQYHEPTQYSSYDPNHSLYYDTVIHEDIIHVKNSYI
jgi:glycosyltransferase involved in cell wall biosynthesis